MRDDDDDVDDDDRPRRKKRRQQKSGPPVALIFGILAGVFILVGFGIGMFFALRPKAKPVETAQTTEPERLNAPPAGPKQTPSATAGWVAFEHPEGLYSARVPVKPVHFVQPKGGSVFAGNEAFFNSSSFVSTTKDLLASMDIRVFTELGLETDRRNDEKLGPKQFGLRATRKNVMWGGYEAVEDRDDKTQISVRRRLYLGNRLYQFSIQGSPGRPTAEELTTFFDSFRPGKVS